MKEKIKKEEKQAGAGGGSIFDSVPPLQESKECNVSSGPYSESLPVAGMPVGEIRKKFSDRFDIDEKAQAIINGIPSGEETILKAGESLMFVRHAGEKGANNQVLLDKDRAKVGSEGTFGSGLSMDIEDLCQRVGPGMSTGEVILPAGVKTVLSQGPLTLWFWEQAPRIHKFRWIASDSPKPYGPGTEYRDVRIALPYLVIMAAFVRNGDGMPNLILKDECFFRNEPLKSIDDELCFPGLLNCSKYGSGGEEFSMNHPLSWICTQHLKPNKQMQSSRPGDRFQGGFEAVRYCLLETAFNLSSEHHEGNSWYGATKKVSTRIETVEKWEENTRKDPLFVLDIPWIKAKHTIRTLADRVFKQNGQSAGSIKTADDLARIIINR